MEIIFDTHPRIFEHFFQREKALAEMDMNVKTVTTTYGEIRIIADPTLKRNEMRLFPIIVEDGHRF